MSLTARYPFFLQLPFMARCRLTDLLNWWGPVWLLPPSNWFKWIRKFSSNPGKRPKETQCVEEAATFYFWMFLWWSHLGRVEKFCHLGVCFLWRQYCWSREEPLRTAMSACAKKSRQTLWIITGPCQAPTHTIQIRIARITTDAGYFTFYVICV